MKIIFFILFLVIGINAFANVDVLPLEEFVSKVLGVSIEKFKVKIEVSDVNRAYYSLDRNTICLPKNYTQEMLVHELTHAILQHHYPYMLSEKTQEILAKYSEYVYVRIKDN